MINKLIFLLSESLRAFLRTKLPAAISSITIGISLVIFSLAYFTYENLLGYSHQFKSRYRIEVFFYNDLDLDKGRDLFNTILIMDGIEQGEFIDKERASKLISIILHDAPLLVFNYRLNNGDKREKKIDVNDFVGIKGWKAIGNKILKHKNMSGFKFIESQIKEKAIKL